MGEPCGYCVRAVLLACRLYEMSARCGGLRCRFQHGELGNAITGSREKDASGFRPSERACHSRFYVFRRDGHYERKNHPVVIGLVTLDNNARTTNMHLSHAPVAFLPTTHTIKVFRLDRDNFERVHMVESKILANGVGILLEQAMRLLFNDFKSGEAGFVAPYEGTLQKFRVPLSRVVTDMEERRVWMKLTRGNWPCYHCYAFGGSPEDVAMLLGPNPDPAILTKFNALRQRPRCKEIDERFFKSFEMLWAPSYTGATEDTIRNAAARLLGFKAKYIAPFNGLAMSRSVSDYCPFEGLHMLDGGLKRFAEILQSTSGKNLFENG